MSYLFDVVVPQNPFDTVGIYLEPPAEEEDPLAAVKAVMMVYDKPPFAMVGRKSLGINAPCDIVGKVLGAPPPDGAWAQFPIFAAENGIDMGKVTVEPVGFPVREPMLAEGQVAAIT